MKQVIKLTESELREMIVNAINESMEEGENEGKINDFFKNIRTGFDASMNTPIDYHANPNAKDFMDQTMNNAGQRIGNFKQGYKRQKQYTRFENLRKELEELVNDKVINPKATVSQLINPMDVKPKKNERGNGAMSLGGARANLTRNTKNYKLRKEAIEKIIDQVLNETIKKEVF